MKFLPQEMTHLAKEIRVDLDKLQESWDKPFSLRERAIIQCVAKTLVRLTQD